MHGKVIGSVAYHEQVNALGAQGVALVEVLKVIGEKGARITPDIMASGGSGSGDGGGIGTVLLLNLFRNQINLPAANGEKVAAEVSSSRLPSACEQATA